MENVYAQVIVPLPLAGQFTYIVPPHMVDKVRPGIRVGVPFGSKCFYTGVVASVSKIAPPAGVQLKEIAAVLESEPSTLNSQRSFWEWMAGYYLCEVGEVFKAALPSGLKIESETRVEINKEAEPELLAACSADECALLEWLGKNGPAKVENIEKALKKRSVAVDVQRLTSRGILAVTEKLTERYRAVKKAYVRLLISRNDSSALDNAFASVKGAPKQEEALTALVALAEFYRADQPLIEVPLDVLCERAGTNRSIVNALAAKGLCEIYNKEISRFSYNGAASGILPVLTQPQHKALDEIMRSFSQKAITLLHGVTSSGKTEIYIHLIDQTLRHGKQALMLVPEIALTTQLTRRLQKVFGEKVLVYHSKFSDNERVELYRRLLDNRSPQLILGARSAVFLPFNNLGLVIVDEEHESSYKQHDPAPRYNGRDAAAMLAMMHGAKTLYGSATPSVETYYKALSGKFGLVELKERYEGVSLPEVEIVDMKEQRRRRAVTGCLSNRLLEATLNATAARKQAILFLNRRGYAPMARCGMCDFTPKCDFCDVSLTYHKHTNRLHCHYCGAEYNVPSVCPQCKEPQISIVGWGTERVEEDLASLFENRTVLRMDLDTTRNKEGYGRIIDDFSARKADILVGTQMVTKGLDFGEVELVGVLNADALASMPDFRASERAFNMLVQVAGRAGRRENRGKVFIQSYNPSDPVLLFASAHDYRGFYEHEIRERQAFNFPPFCRIINIYIKHRNADKVAERASAFATALRAKLGPRVFGPQQPAVSRVQNMYIRKIMLKIESELSLKWVKDLLRQEYVALCAAPTMSGLVVYYDVDPC